MCLINEEKNQTKYGGAPMRKILMAQELPGGGRIWLALLLAVVLTLIFSGCNGTGGPVNIDGSGVGLRFGQNINSPSNF